MPRATFCYSRRSGGALGRGDQATSLLRSLATWPGTTRSQRYIYGAFFMTLRASSTFLAGGLLVETPLQLNFPWRRPDGQEKVEAAPCRSWREKLLSLPSATRYPSSNQCRGDNPNKPPSSDPERHPKRWPLHEPSCSAFFLWLGLLSFSSGPCKDAP